MKESRNTQKGTSEVEFYSSTFILLKIMSMIISYCVLA